MGRSCTRIVALVVLTACCETAYAQATPADARATILLRALAYDRRLKERAGSNVTVAIVFQQDDRGSVAAKNEMHKAFASLSTQTLDGLPIGVIDHAYTNRDGLAAAVRSGADVLYLTPGLAGRLGEIVQLSQDTKVVTATSEREYVDQGVSLAVTVVGGRPKIVVNVSASKSAGMDLSAQLLQLAEVVR